MKNYLFAAILTIASSSIFAQCKFGKNLIDPFTGGQTIETEPFLIARNFLPIHSTFFTVEVKDDKITLSVKYTSDQLSGVSKVLDNDILLLKLKDTEIIQLTPNQEYLAFIPQDTKSIYNATNSTVGGQSSPNYSVEPKYILSMEDLKHLASSEIELFRIGLNGDTFDHETRTNISIKFKDTMKCLVRELN